MPGDLLFHPTPLILIAVTALSLFQKHGKIFSLIATIFPFIVGLVMLNQRGLFMINLGSVDIIWQYSDLSKLIGFAFLACLISANIFAIANYQKSEVIFGSAYGAFSLLTILAEDFISMFVGIEIMMILSSFIIFIGNNRSSPGAAKKYFITHLVSSNMILIGVTYLINKHGSANMLLLTPLISDTGYSGIALITMLTGLLINVAAFPFSGWMVNYYQSASPSGFLYLISFTTKVSIVLLIKLFAGYELLASIGTVMIIYSAIKALPEDKIQGLLCYLSIMQMGVLLIGISTGNESAILATGIYLFIHIIYKSLLSLISSIFMEYGQVLRCSELAKINNLSILLPLLVAIGVMINIPLSTGLYAKLEISKFAGGLLYYITALAGITTILALPFRQYFTAGSSRNLYLNPPVTASIYFMTCILLICGFFGQFLPVINNIGEVSLFSVPSMKQLTIIGLAMIVAFFLKINKKQVKSLNLIEWIGNIFFLYYSYQTAKTEKESLEPWDFDSLQKQTLVNLASLHNQQTAIFIAFLLLIIILISFILYTI